MRVVRLSGKTLASMSTSSWVAIMNLRWPTVTRDMIMDAQPSRTAGGSKVIPRMVPPRIGQFLAMYMVYARALTDRSEADRWAFHGQIKPPSDFICHDQNGHWEGAKISKAMTKWTHYYMGVRLTLQNWRQFAIAIGKKHNRGKQADAKGDSDSDLGLDLDEAEQ